jgi:alpha-glucosidase (family GH31 glycosyl hydrolase)
MRARDHPTGPRKPALCGQRARSEQHLPPGARAGLLRGHAGRGGRGDHHALPTEEGPGGPNEVWSFGEEAYEIIKGLLFLRERLRPYIMEQMQAAHEKGTPPMRPLFFDFPGDPACWDVEDQFMFGPHILVAPVLYEGARSRQVYLPDGARWTDAWTDEGLDGGQWITADAPLERIPLYLREGKELPGGSLRPR